MSIRRKLFYQTDKLGYIALASLELKYYKYTWLIKSPACSNEATIKIFYKIHEGYILEGLCMLMNKNNQSVCNS